MGFLFLIACKDNTLVGHGEIQVKLCQDRSSMAFSRMTFALASVRGPRGG